MAVFGHVRMHALERGIRVSEQRSLLNTDGTSEDEVLRSTATGGVALEDKHRTSWLHSLRGRTPSPSLSDDELDDDDGYVGDRTESDTGWQEVPVDVSRWERLKNELYGFTFDTDNYRQTWRDKSEYTKMASNQYWRNKRQAWQGAWRNKRQAWQGAIRRGSGYDTISNRLGQIDQRFKVRMLCSDLVSIVRGLITSALQFFNPTALMFIFLLLAVFVSLFTIHQLLIWATMDPHYAFEAAKTAFYWIELVNDGIATFVGVCNSFFEIVVPMWNGLAHYIAEGWIYAGIDVLVLMFTNHKYEGIITEDDVAFKGFRVRAAIFHRVRRLS